MNWVNSILFKGPIIIIWIAAVIDPVGNLFGIRYLGLIGLFFPFAYLILSGSIFSRRFDVGLFIFIVFGCLIPVWGLFVYFFRGAGGQFTDTSYLAAGVLMLSLFFYKDKRLTRVGVLAFLLSGRILTICTLVCFISIIFNDQFMPSVFVSGGGAYIGERIYGSVQLPYIYFVASPILIFLLAYDAAKLDNDFRFLRVLLFISTICALFLSGTRAHILIALTVSIWYPLLCRYRVRSFVYIQFISVFLLAVVITSAASDISDAARRMFDPLEYSNNTKLTMLGGYQIIFSEPIAFFFGQGFNAHTWSQVVQSIVNSDVGATKTELTYFEIFRVFGFIVGGVVHLSLFFVLFRAYRLPKEFEWVFPGLFVLLVNAALNPYLFSTNGILPLTLALAAIYHFSARGHSSFSDRF